MSLLDSHGSRAFDPLVSLVMLNLSTKEVGVRRFPTWIGLATVLAVILPVNPSVAQLKIGYVDSQKILESHKDAQDARKQLAELNKSWEDEARNMQSDLAKLQDELESQRLLLSDEKRKEKETEIQNLYLRFQQFQQENGNMLFFVIIIQKYLFLEMV